MINRPRGDLTATWTKITSSAPVFSDFLFFLSSAVFRHAQLTVAAQSGRRDVRFSAKQPSYRNVTPTILKSQKERYTRITGVEGDERCEGRRLRAFGSEITWRKARDCDGWRAVGDHDDDGGGGEDGEKDDGGNDNGDDDDDDDDDDEEDRTRRKIQGLTGYVGHCRYIRLYPPSAARSSFLRALSTPPTVRPTA
ncbi:hypothetical protein PUN28_009407 [Cardiocondyla obscurior]|uniref:Uncharacterized protein n=1 Tax=Cardiocondyla obscurior TaxID=286306 RepID=A0AAW2FTM4_9HYME